MKKEVEIRSFITKDKYYSLKSLFTEKADLIEESEEETYYLKGDKDLRIQKSDKRAKLWLKEGEIHDESRNEIEVTFDCRKFDDLKLILEKIGYRPKVKWARRRLKYKKNNMIYCLDFTKDFGYILEIEKVIDCNAEEEAVLNKIKKRFKELNVEITPRREFQKKNTKIM